VSPLWTSWGAWKLSWLGIPFTFLYGLPLLVTGLVWVVAAILGGLLVSVLAGTAGVFLALHYGQVVSIGEAE
jgi:hypothetical protein